MSEKDRTEQNEQCPELRTCPPCNGTGLVTRPPYVAGDQTEWVANGVGPYRCKSCDGCGWIVLLADGCVGGHSPSLVNCVMGSDL